MKQNKNTKSKNKKSKRKYSRKLIHKKPKNNRRRTYKKKSYQMVPIYGGEIETSSTTTNEYKEILKKKLKKMLDNNQINDPTYNDAVSDIENGDIFKTKTLLAFFNPIQDKVKILGDAVINQPVNSTDNVTYKPFKKTLVKIIWFPKSYKHYIKGKIPKENIKLELDEYMIIVKDVYIDQYGKIMSDINSVDNFLANLLNGCVGPKCKDGEIRPPVLLKKDFEVNYNNNGNLLDEKDKLENQLSLMGEDNSNNGNSEKNIEASSNIVPSPKKDLSPTTNNDLSLPVNSSQENAKASDLSTQKGTIVISPNNNLLKGE